MSGEPERLYCDLGSLQACGGFPLAIFTAICRSSIMICSGLYLFIGMSSSFAE
jgi:hypothetical protein